MSRVTRGQIRRSQIVTTYGPGSLIDLPRDSAIMAGVDEWAAAEPILEPRLERHLSKMTGVGLPQLIVPPTPDPAEFWARNPTGIDAYRFPEWFVVEYPRKDESSGSQHSRSRRLVHLRSLDDRGRHEGRSVVATRFVRACPNGHVADIDWYRFVHDGPAECRGALWLDETGATGELANLRVRCRCGKSRPMIDAANLSLKALGSCRGDRPWLGRNVREDCNQPARLLIRTGSNAYFPLLVRTLALPAATPVDGAVERIWGDLLIVESLGELAFIKRKPNVAAALHGFDDSDVLNAIGRRRAGPSGEPSIKGVEIKALLAQPEGFGDDIPIDPNFHARRLPADMRSSTYAEQVEAVVQVHRLREVVALAGFTRLEASMPDIDGVYRDDVKRAEIAREPQKFPAVENRGEGVLLQLSAAAISRWRERPAVMQRVDDLERGHAKWAEERNTPLEFPGGAYIMLHTLSHLLLQSLSERCGYPAASIRERIYVDEEEGLYGILLYTSSPDAEGTLGGLVQQARRIDGHLARALDGAELCSNDPVCAQHAPSESLEERWLHGAACHGCTLVAETSCEMWNDYLDRALVVPTLDSPDAAFFPKSSLADAADGAP